MKIDRLSDCLVGCPQIGRYSIVRCSPQGAQRLELSVAFFPRCANPSYTASELGKYHYHHNHALSQSPMSEYQLRETKAKFIITHSASLDTALKASSCSSIPVGRIAIIQPPTHEHHPSSSHYRAHPEEALATARQNVVTVQSLIERGLGDLNDNGPQFIERRLQKGEAKTKLAFLSFSSGTTGRPKACYIVQCFIPRLS
jgi:4-coumarate--CoA ligase